MFRPVVILSLLITSTLAACGGIRFLPYGEETPTSLVAEIPPMLDTALPASEASEVATETSEPGFGTASPSVGIRETDPKPAAMEPGEPSSTPTASLVPTSIPLKPAVTQEAFEPAPLTIEERRPYRLQPGSPAWLPNFLHPEAGCNWMGVAGQVFDLAGNPETALVIEIGGELGGVQVQSLSLTGAAPAYGPGGYEVHLRDQAIESSSALWLQVKDLSGKELADRVSFDTFSDCGRNLVLINFVETSFEIEVLEYFFPVFYNGVTGSTIRSLEGADLGEIPSVTQFYLPVFFNRFFPEVEESRSPGPMLMIPAWLEIS